MFIILSTLEIVCFYFTALTSLYVNYKSIQPFTIVKSVTDIYTVSHVSIWIYCTCIKSYFVYALPPLNWAAQNIHKWLLRNYLYYAHNYFFEVICLNQVKLCEYILHMWVYYYYFYIEK